MASLVQGMWRDPGDEEEATFGRPFSDFVVHSVTFLACTITTARREESSTQKVLTTTPCCRIPNGDGLQGYLVGNIHKPEFSREQMYSLSASS